MALQAKLYENTIGADKYRILLKRFVLFAVVFCLILLLMYKTKDTET